MNRYSNDALTASLLQCTHDIRKAASTAAFPLSMQVRAYDLLDGLLASAQMGGDMGLDPDAVREFCDVYVQVEAALADCFDADALTAEAEGQIAPARAEVEELRFAAASAASLHEFAKEVFDIWQTQGIFARKRALKELRQRAGFRLESHRIGNYVAKTFDLMNEAQARFARAQQAVFAADVKYKIRKDTYKEIYNILCKTMN